MQLYGFINPATSNPKVVFFPVFEEGDRVIKISPRGFANEADELFVLPGGEEAALEMADEYDNDVNAWTSERTMTKQQAAQRNYSFEAPIDYVTIAHAGGIHDYMMPFDADELRTAFGAEAVTAAVMSALARWEEQKSKSYYDTDADKARRQEYIQRTWFEWGILAGGDHARP